MFRRWVLKALTLQPAGQSQARSGSVLYSMATTRCVPAWMQAQQGAITVHCSIATPSMNQPVMLQSAGLVHSGTTLHAIRSLRAKSHKLAQSTNKAKAHAVSGLKKAARRGLKAAPSVRCSFRHLSRVPPLYLHKRHQNMKLLQFKHCCQCGTP
jgi:hypothetical protein